MKRFLSLVLALATIFGCLAALSSCGDEVDYGAEFAVYLGAEMYDFDPGDYYVSANAEQVMSMLYEPLFRLDSDGDLKKAAAESYEIDKETRTITVKLRESYWSTGTRVQAHDFEFAWKRILNPENSNPAAALFYDIEGAIETKNSTGDIYGADLGISAISVDTIKIVYRNGADCDQLLKNLAAVAASPINRSAYDANPSAWSKTLSSMAFNGPFTVSIINHEEGSFRLTRNPGYHQDPIESKPMKYVEPYILFTDYTKPLSYKNIDADKVEDIVFYMADAPLDERAENKKNAEVTDLLSTYTYVFNTENEFLANKDVRRALSLAIDRTAIVEAITFGKAATGLIPDVMNDFREDALISAEAKLDEAKALLNKPEISAINDKTIDLVVGDDAQSKKIAELVSKAWRDLGHGIEVNVKYAQTVITEVQQDDNTVKYYDSELQYLVKGAAEGNCEFDVIGIDISMYSSDPFVALAAFSSNYSGNGYDLNNNTVTARGNIAGWSSDEYDELIDTAYTTTNGGVRAKKIRQAEAMLIDECVIAPIVFNQNFAFISKELKNVNTDGFGHFVLTKAKLKNYEKYRIEE